MITLVQLGNTEQLLLKITRLLSSTYSPRSNANVWHCSRRNYSIHQLLNNSKEQKETCSYEAGAAAEGLFFRFYKVCCIIFLRQSADPSRVGTPSCLPACRLETWRLLGCLALYRCRDAFSLSRLFSASRLSSGPIPAPKSKRSSNTPRANCP